MKDCYAALGIIHQTWSPVPGRIKDFIATPRPNGYRSLHTSVISDAGFPFEVQIRTSDMHEIAEDGIASHWKYKEGRVGERGDEPYFQWLRQVLEWQQEVRDPQEFLQNLKIDLYSDEVHIFTPKGQVITLPKGATPVDFAYAIHTDVGDRCVGARISGRMVPLRTRLTNGDIVEIVTDKKHTPSRDWLNFVVTSKARNKIRHVLQAEERERSVEIGRKLLEKDARRYDLNIRTLLADEMLQKATEALGMQKIDELLAAVGYGKVQARQVLAKLVPDDQLMERERKARPGMLAAVRRVFSGDGDRITVRGADDMLVFRARCCNPIRGERIVGYITRGKGVSVHSVNCPNVVNLMYDPDRRIDVDWDRSAGEARYSVRLALEVEDRRGLLAEVSARVADVEHQHHEDRGGDFGRGQPGPDRHDGRDSRPRAAREGREVSQEDHRRDQRGAGGEVARGARWDRVRGADPPASAGRPGYPKTATSSISTLTSFGSRATWTVARAGAGAGKNSA